MKLVSTLSMLLMLLMLLIGCEQQNMLERKPLAELIPDDQRYQLAKAGKIIKFPDDHLPHLGYRHEWWYLTANLHTDTGEVFAAQWTLFRTAVNQRHWYFAHAALGDIRLHESAFRHGRSEFSNVTITDKPFSAHIDEWLWQSSADLLPAKLTFGEQSSWQAELFLTSSLSMPPVLNNSVASSAHFFLQGEQGYSRKHPKLNIGSHYYSQPFIDVSGRVLWQGQWKNVTGTAWFDREWGSQLLAPDQLGWDWFSLHLDNDTALMVYRMRSTIQDYSYGNLMYRDGSSKKLSGEEIILTATAQGKNYPSQFSVVIESEAIDINLKVVNESQINRFGIEYFEGMATFSGSHQGKGFVEMTGYDNE